MYLTLPCHRSSWLMYGGCYLWRRKKASQILLEVRTEEVVERTEEDLDNAAKAPNIVLTSLDRNPRFGGTDKVVVDCGEETITFRCGNQVRQQPVKLSNYDLNGGLTQQVHVLINCKKSIKGRLTLFVIIEFRKIFRCVEL